MTSMTPLSKTALEEIEQRVNAAPKGPWLVDEVYGQEIVTPARLVLASAMYGTRAKEIAAFIANARQDVPALIATVRDLEEEIASRFALQPGDIELIGEANARMIRELKGNENPDAVKLMRVVDALLAEVRRLNEENAGLTAKLELASLVLSKVQVLPILGTTIGDPSL